MKTEWAECIAMQCKEAYVPFFMKQMEIDGNVSRDISLFPSSLQIREYP
jgi:protein gp37